MMSVMVVVIDTNVFVGACMGVGASAEVVRRCLTGALEPVMSATLMLEYEDVLGRAALFESCRLDPAERNTLFDIFASRCRWVKTYYAWRPNLKDEGDNHLVELAVASGARYLVSWNTKDFARMELKFPGLLCCNPPTLLKECKT